MGVNRGDIRVWRDIGTGLGKNADIPFDPREFTTRENMQGIVFPASANDEGSIIPQGSAAEKNWTYYWHLDDPNSEQAWLEKDRLQARGWTIASTEYFKPNREYYRVIGDKIYWGRKVCFVLPEERLLVNDKADRDVHDRIMNGLHDTGDVQRAANDVDIRTATFENIRSEPVKPRSKR